MVERIMKVTKESLKKAQWMSEETKKEALEKVNK